LQQLKLTKRFKETWNFREFYKHGGMYCLLFMPETRKAYLRFGHKANRSRCRFYSIESVYIFRHLVWMRMQWTK